MLFTQVALAYSVYTILTFFLHESFLPLPRYAVLMI